MDSTIQTAYAAGSYYLQATTGTDQVRLKHDTALSRKLQEKPLGSRRLTTSPNDWFVRRKEASGRLSVSINPTTMRDFYEQRFVVNTEFFHGAISERAIAVLRLHAKEDSPSQEMVSYEAAKTNPAVGVIQPLFMGRLIEEAIQLDLIVLPLFHGDLTWALATRHGDPSHAKDMTGALVQASRGLQSLHGMGLLHNDLSPFNILVRWTSKGAVEAVVADLECTQKERVTHRKMAPCFPYVRAPESGPAAELHKLLTTLVTFYPGSSGFGAIQRECITEARRLLDILQPLLSEEELHTGYIGMLREVLQLQPGVLARMLHGKERASSLDATKFPICSRFLGQCSEQWDHSRSNSWVQETLDREFPQSQADRLEARLVSFPSDVFSFGCTTAAVSGVLCGGQRPSREDNDSVAAVIYNEVQAMRTISSKYPDPLGQKLQAAILSATQFTPSCRCSTQQLTELLEQAAATAATQA